MPDPRTPAMTGGCQCGAVRYALYASPEHASICHCRMCQRAMGNVFAPLARVKMVDFGWTRGAPKVFASSTVAERGFCADCGTPLTFRYVATPNISVAIGSLDHPEAVNPEMHYGTESRVPWLKLADGLPETTTDAFDGSGLLAGMCKFQRDEP